MAEPSGAGDSIPLDGPGLDMAAGEEFLQEVFQILLEEGVRKSTDVTQKVCDWKEPQELRELLDLELRSDGEGRERLLQRCRDVLRFSVRTGHPRFFNQLFSGLDHHALAGRFLTETLNTSPYTYEVAPVLVLMEEQVLVTLRELVGWSSGDGIFAPGGSISNMLAMNVARFRRFPESRSRGNWDLPRLGLFASQESHYSILKGAALLGIGTDNVHLVRTDERGKMIPEELEKEIQRVKAEGSEPLFVCATSGTTVLGAFDPLDAVADICARHGLWLHVDAAWGGSALLSPRLRHLLAGIHRADSVTWNPHKLLMVGLQCSAFLLRDSSGLLQRCHGVGASYLFQRDKFYDVSLDTGDKSPQCGRRADGLKLWILWKAVGTKGLAQRVERAFGATRYLLEQVKRREGFQLVMEPEFINLCFWFIPPSLRGQESSPEFWDKLGKVAPAIKEKMIRRGSMMVGYQPHGSQVNFFRQIITNPAVTRQDLDFFLDEIQELGWDL
ncbi:cysteine sulfinic acid decarboxylase [Pyrgilauda ruficollis]|uniref:cysteine sulfinic acid decarboxylase n=1 Tax=Pyrgilauda ruficollis TaxID=221976 RepID=UPI001B860302|nr:cysteine sulfinic acid decarboxylase [Pyrgilauda ruficollis]XP_041332018.1 cysteine sulfinic acid decarboxylase [Pyrgilauda ruficollis]XP_041332019.1 cysteine sulfinic acid decarboxylase [Pyrgilauda ruficollis]XP_041332020.1 cysteine sulfinic acid decarboxylase [Pyrgilauda ruficollis]XP_041332021.1 cysteine sulfinic acid decarboxylase [Pyrgilauda ruficollis]